MSVGVDMDEKRKAIAVFALIVGFAYLSYLIVAPFLTFIVLGLLLAYLFHPVYAHIRERRSESLSAGLVMLIVLLLIIIPGIWLTASLIAQATSAYNSAVANGVTLESIASRIPGINASDLASILEPQKLANALPQIITVTGEVLLGLFMLFLVMYYALKEGKEWFAAASAFLPLRAAYRKRLQESIEKMARALFYGQVLSSVFVGALIGLVFVLFGVPNPVFWGFVMMVLAFLPVVGAPVVFIPAGIILMFKGDLFSGTSVIVLGSIVNFFADYYVRPKLVSRSSALHPLTVIVGAVGGVYAMGFIGFLLGPLVLGIFLTLLTFDTGAA